MVFEYAFSTNKIFAIISRSKLLTLINTLFVLWHTHIYQSITRFKSLINPYLHFVIKACF